jgi:hypothetical protein
MGREHAAGAKAHLDKAKSIKDTLGRTNTTAKR